MILKDLAKEVSKLQEKIRETDGKCYSIYLKRALDNRDVFLKSARKFGTPQYILDESLLEEKAVFFRDTFRKYMPLSEFFYAFKSNDLPYLIKKLKGFGYNADVAGLFELKLALDLGFRRIIFTGPGKSEGELRLAIEHKDKVIVNIDNEDELDRIIRLMGKAKSFQGKLRVGLRVNSNDEVTRSWSKFGIPLGRLSEVVDKLDKASRLELCGMHFHCSWNRTPDRHISNIRIIGESLRRISKEKLSSLSFFDIGGGFEPEDEGMLLKSAPQWKMIEAGLDGGKDASFGLDPHDFFIENPESLKGFAGQIAASFKESIFKHLGRELAVFLEPGRYLSKHSTAILTKVIAVKTNGVIVDGGSNLIGDDSLYSWEFTPILNLSRPSLKLNSKVIYGALCDPTDIFGYKYFGDECRVGDILLILNQGAYTFSFARRFIKPLAPYIVQKANKGLSVAKKREIFENRYGGCKI